MLSSPCRDSISGNLGSFYSRGAFSGWRALTIEHSLMSGCVQIRTMEGIHSLINTSNKQPTVVKELSAKSLSSERAQAAIFSWVIDVDNTLTTSCY